MIDPRCRYVENSGVPSRSLNAGYSCVSLDQIRSDSRMCTPGPHGRAVRGIMTHSDMIDAARIISSFFIRITFSGDDRD